MNDNSYNKKYDITLSELSKILRYDSVAGQFYRKRDNKLLGSYSNGYREISLNLSENIRTRYRVHILVWLFETGSWPTQSIDHINGIRDDNRYINLREVTQSQNNQNIANIGKGSTGLLGVSFMKAASEKHGRKRLYRAEIRIDGKVKYLGSYFTPEEAHAAYMYAKSNYHTFSARIADIDKFDKSERFVPRYDIDGNLAYLCVCGESDPDMFYDYHSRSTCKKCIFKTQLARKREKKPNKYRFKDGILYEHLCGHCGETDATKFFSYTSKSTCIPCYTKKQAVFRERKRENFKNGVALIGLLCRYCGTTDSTKFTSYTTKKACKECYNKKRVEEYRLKVSSTV